MIPIVLFSILYFDVFRWVILISFRTHSIFKEASITQNTKASFHHHSIFSQQFHWFGNVVYSVSSTIQGTSSPTLPLMPGNAPLPSVRMNSRICLDRESSVGSQSIFYFDSTMQYAIQMIMNFLLITIQENLDPALPVMYRNSISCLPTHPPIRKRCCNSMFTPLKYQQKHLLVRRVGKCCNKNICGS